MARFSRDAFPPSGRLESKTVKSTPKETESPEKTVELNLINAQETKADQEKSDRKETPAQKEIDAVVKKTKAALARAYGNVMETEQTLLLLQRAIGKEVPLKEAKETLEKVERAAKKAKVSGLKKLFGRRGNVAEKQKLKQKIQEIIEGHKAKTKADVASK